MMMASMLLLVMIIDSSNTAVRTQPAPTAVPLQVTGAPLQTAVVANASPITWQREKYSWEITPLAEFQVSGRVLTRQAYKLDWQSEISPIDLAIGWGELNDAKADKYIEWWQSGRWYYYRWHDSSPYDEKYLRTHSSNIHIIPATEDLEEILLRIRKDDQITLEGKLVNVEATNESKRWQNQTSLTRNDSGNGACEILLVERLIWNGQEYR